MRSRAQSLGFRFLASGLYGRIGEFELESELLKEGYIGDHIGDNSRVVEGV